MRKRSRANAKGATSTIGEFTISQSQNKRKLCDEVETETELNPVNVDSVDEVSDINRSGRNLSSSKKRLKVDFDVFAKYKICSLQKTLLIESFCYIAFKQ